MSLLVPQKLPMMGDSDEIPSLSSMVSAPLQSIAIEMILIAMRVPLGDETL